MTEDFEEYGPEPDEELAEAGGLDPDLIRQLAALPGDERNALAEIVRRAIEDIDFAEWEGEVGACCDGECHVVVIRPTGHFQIWCACVGDWVGSSK